MKNFLLVFCSTFLIANSSHATGFFIGGDALHSNSRHEAKNSNFASGANDGEVVNGSQSGYGVNAGIRGDLLFLLASAELFYDNLNISTKNFPSTTNTGEKVGLDYRYGAKVNAGFAIFPRVTPFATFGLSDVRYEINGTALNSKKSKSEFTPIYGVGLLVDLPFGITAKAAYDYQQFNTQSPASDAKIRTRLGVARLGVIYNF